MSLKTKLTRSFEGINQRVNIKRTPKWLLAVSYLRLRTLRTYITGLAVYCASSLRLCLRTGRRIWARSLTARGEHEYLIHNLSQKDCLCIITNFAI